MKVYCVQMIDSMQYLAKIQLRQTVLSQQRELVCYLISFWLNLFNADEMNHPLSEINVEPQSNPWV